MEIDFRSYGPSVIEADICIVGAGPAGISVARQFVGTRYSICVLESGGKDLEHETQALYRGLNIGADYYDLDAARLRYFGGTTNAWNGRCAPLDMVDFQGRHWVPYSGWPVTRRELMPCYRRAQKLLGLGPFVYDERMWDSLGVEPPELDPSRIRSSFWRFDEERSPFGIDRCRDVFVARNIQVVLHANVSSIQVNEGATAVRQLEVESLEGRRAKVRAKLFVLACGGIETPRLLLASRSVEACGVGNCNDLVGRFFMEHAHASGGVIRTARPYEVWDLFRKRFRPGRPPVAPVLRPSEAVQREHRILNTAMTLKLQRSPTWGLPLPLRRYWRARPRLRPNSSGRRLWHLYKHFNAALARCWRPALRFQAHIGIKRLHIVLLGEQTPNPHSRVMLGQERDCLGMPMVTLNWQQSPLDTHSAFVLVDTFGREFERLGLGSVEIPSWLRDGAVPWPVDPTVSNSRIGGYHHMGTTRMSDDPRQGVVDRECRVHGYENLFVAGSSVFPTSGWANPTLTIIALSVRLADHLRARLQRSDSVVLGPLEDACELQPLAEAG